MATPSFDLVDIIRTIQKKRRFVIVITAIAMVLGGTFFAIKKKKYKRGVLDCSYIDFK